MKLDGAVPVPPQPRRVVPSASSQWLDLLRSEPGGRVAALAARVARLAGERLEPLGLGGG